MLHPVPFLFRSFQFGHAQSQMFVFLLQTFDPR